MACCHKHGTLKTGDNDSLVGHPSEPSVLWPCLTDEWERE